MKSSELRYLIRYIMTEANNILDEMNSTASVGGAIDIPAAFKKKKFEYDTTFLPSGKPKEKKKPLKEEEEKKEPETLVAAANRGKLWSESDKLQELTQLVYAVVNETIKLRTKTL